MAYRGNCQREPDSLGAVRKYTMRSVRKYSVEEFEDEEMTKKVGKRT